MEDVNVTKVGVGGQHRGFCSPMGPFFLYPAFVACFNFGPSDSLYKISV